MKTKILALMMASIILLPTLTLAQVPVPPVEEGETITLSSIEELVMDVVDSLVFIVSLLVVGVFVYAGFLWLTAGGDQAKVTKAKTLFRNAVIGALIIFGVGLIINTIADFATSPSSIVR